MGIKKELSLLGTKKLFKVKKLQHEHQALQHFHLGLRVECVWTNKICSITMLGLYLTLIYLHT